MKRNDQRIGLETEGKARFLAAGKLAWALKAKEFLRVPSKQFMARHHSAALHLDLPVLRLLPSSIRHP
jgi:hypothetical protein